MEIKARSRTGHVSYLINGKTALRDEGQKLYLLDQRESTRVDSTRPHPWPGPQTQRNSRL